jgi:hypothetical protein
MIYFELVRIDRFTDVRANYLVARYTKFQPNLLFAIITVLLLSLDIFNHLYV